MVVLHIPSWFPNKKNTIGGIFTKKMIEAIAKYDTRQHIILHWHNTSYASFKHPFGFIKAVLKSLQKPKVMMDDKVKYYTFDYFWSNEKIFGSNDKRLKQKILSVILDILKVEKVELLHAHVTQPAGEVANLISNQIKLPYIISEHMSPFPFNAYKSEIERLIITPIQYANFTVAVSSHQAKEVYSTTGVTPYIIPNVVDENEFQLQTELREKTMFRFLVVGILSFQKGIDILLQSIALLKKKNIVSFKVAIGGDGPILEDLKLLASKLAIENEIEWLGSLSRDQLKYQLAICSCFVSSSRNESFGVVLVEALACGVPIIATRSGGPIDIVNNTNGILIENENPEALAIGMEWMMNNRDSFNAFTIREDYLARYSQKVVAAKYINLYDTIISQKNI
jgi:glycosyltransferase involved in cell wall biosynthesis